MIENLRKTIKSTPLLHTFLFPAVTFLRRLRPPKPVREVNRFRRYCLNLSKTVSEPMFVKVGANDGVTGDPCSDILLACNNWHGLLIEPVPYCFARLQTHFQDPRRFRLEQVAIGASAGEVSFYFVDAKAKQDLPNLPPWFDQLGSFDRNHILKHLDGILEPYIVEATVPVFPLSEILARNQIQEVHLLHIDTEGYDYEVLKTVDFAKHAPLSIFIEHRHLSDPQRAEMLELLHTEGYSVRECGGDYFAVRKAARRV